MVAERLRNLPGLALFETSAPNPACLAGGGSLVLAQPQPEILRGQLHRDVSALETKVEMLGSGQGSGADAAFIAGTVDYDGAYEFRAYTTALLHEPESGRWLALGGNDILSQALTPGAAVLRAFCPPAISLSMPVSEFESMVRRAQAYIASGDIYQVNLSHELRGLWEEDPWWLFTELRDTAPAAFSAYLRQSTRTVISSSPELFLAMDDRRIGTRPIKGTRPRSQDAEADRRHASELQSSPKENAELIMITDLERNDLGQVCEYGSVHVPELLSLESHSHVHHLVSQVEGMLRPGISAVAALQACFPGGSITGAPKKRAREIIAELEPCPRGVYTGAIGWFGPGGMSRFNIAIRTAIHEKGVLRFHVGAGIVADSVPQLEWEETLHKAAGLLSAWKVKKNSCAFNRSPVSSTFLVTGRCSAW